MENKLTERLDKENKEILFKFYEDRDPEPIAKIFRIVVGLTYPIRDKVALKEQLQELKGREAMLGDHIMQILKPEDFGLDSPQNALAKVDTRFVRIAIPTDVMPSQIPNVNLECEEVRVCITIWEDGFVPHYLSHP